MTAQRAIDEIKTALTTELGGERLRVTGLSGTHSAGEGLYQESGDDWNHVTNAEYHFEKDGNGWWYLYQRPIPQNPPAQIAISAENTAETPAEVSGWSLETNLEVSRIVQLDGVDTRIYTESNDTEKEYPCVILTVEGSTEHPVLRGVMAPLSINANFVSIPDSRDNTNATSYADHDTAVEELYCVIGSTELIDTITWQGAIQCFDIRHTAPTIQPDDERRISTIPMDVTCSNL